MQEVSDLREGILQHRFVGITLEELLWFFLYHKSPESFPLANLMMTATIMTKVSAIQAKNDFHSVENAFQDLDCPDQWR